MAVLPITYRLCAPCARSRLSSARARVGERGQHLKEGSRRWRRSTCRLSTPATVSWGSRRSPSRRSRITRTSRRYSKCTRNSSYRSKRVRSTTKMSTPTSSLAGTTSAGPDWRRQADLNDSFPFNVEVCPHHVVLSIAFSAAFFSIAAKNSAQVTTGPPRAGGNRRSSPPAWGGHSVRRRR